MDSGAHAHRLGRVYTSSVLHLAGIRLVLCQNLLDLAKHRLCHSIEEAAAISTGTSETVDKAAAISVWWVGLRADIRVNEISGSTSELGVDSASLTCPYQYGRDASGRVWFRPQWSAHLVMVERSEILVSDRSHLTGLRITWKNSGRRGSTGWHLLSHLSPCERPVNRGCGRCQGEESRSACRSRQEPSCQEPYG